MRGLFGASKVAAHVLVQEYSRYFGMKTECFRAGCITGSNHSGAKLHGFLPYLMKCAVTGAAYKIVGYKRKQVRDNIHSVDLIRAFHDFFKKPGCAEVYNIGGDRYSNCSMLEALSLYQEITCKVLNYEYRNLIPMPILAVGGAFPFLAETVPQARLGCRTSN